MRELDLTQEKIILTKDEIIINQCDDCKKFFIFTKYDVAENEYCVNCGS